MNLLIKLCHIKIINMQVATAEKNKYKNTI